MSLAAAIDELLRPRPSRRRFRPVRAAARRDALIPHSDRLLLGHAEAYDYLAKSIGDWPAQQELARRIGAAGRRAVRRLDHGPPPILCLRPG